MKSSTRNNNKNKNKPKPKKPRLKISLINLLQNSQRTTKTIKPNRKSRRKLR